MYVDREAALRHPIAPMPFDIERGRLRFFAETVGITDPVYFDVDAARAAGHRDILVPPTFLSNSLELSLPNPFGWLAELGVDLTRSTHGSQGFTYHRPAYANDTVVFHRRIVDVYTKKGGALEFVVKQSDVMIGDTLLLESRFISAIRHPEALA